MHNFHRQYNILLLGDSLTQSADETKYNGFAVQLRNHYENKAAVYNLGISGANTEQFMDIVLHSKFRDMFPKDVDKVFIGLGTNDKSGGFKPGTGPTLVQYKDYLTKMYDYCHDNLTKDVVFLLPPTVSGKDANSTKYQEEYAKAMTEVAKSRNASYLDIRTKLKPGDVYQYDGCHFNVLGHKYMYELLEQNIGEHPEWRQHLSKWHFCDRKFISNQEENQESGVCECQATYYKAQYGDQFKCEKCPGNLLHTLDQKSCQCNEIYQQFDLTSKTCKCQQGMQFDANQHCVCSQKLQHQQNTNSLIILLASIIATLILIIVVLTVHYKKTYKQQKITKQASEEVQLLTE